jgi:hypothetical protein
MFSWSTCWKLVAGLSCACRRATPLLAKAAYSGSTIHSILCMRGEHNRKLLEEGCSTEERLLTEQGVL